MIIIIITITVNYRSAVCKTAMKTKKINEFVSRPTAKTTNENEQYEGGNRAEMENSSRGSINRSAVVVR